MQSCTNAFKSLICSGKSDRGPKVLVERRLEVTRRTCQNKPRSSTHKIESCAKSITLNRCAASNCFSRYHNSTKRPSKFTNLGHHLERCAVSQSHQRDLKRPPGSKQTRKLRIPSSSVFVGQHHHLLQSSSSSSPGSLSLKF